MLLVAGTDDAPHLAVAAGVVVPRPEGHHLGDLIGGRGLGHVESELLQRRLGFVVLGHRLAVGLHVRASPALEPMVQVVGAEVRRTLLEVPGTVGGDVAAQTAQATLRQIVGAVIGVVDAPVVEHVQASHGDHEILAVLCLDLLDQLRAGIAHQGHVLELLARGPEVRDAGAVDQRSDLIDRGCDREAGLARRLFVRLGALCAQLRHSGARPGVVTRFDLLLLCGLLAGLVREVHDLEWGSSVFGWIAHAPQYPPARTFFRCSEIFLAPSF